MIPGLDGIRAIAILLVFAYHSDLLEVGWVGVQLFFVLSGFLITGILLDMKDSLPAGKYFAKFYGRRFLRIFPLYYFYLILMAVLAYQLIRVNFHAKYMGLFLDQVWSAFLYVYDFFYRVAWFQQSQFLDHFWSLSVEEQFYIFWPLLLLLVPQKHLKKLFISFIILGTVFRALLYMLYVSGSSLWVFREPAALVIYSWPLSHLDAFALGAYISRYSLPRAKGQLLVLALLVPAIGFTTNYLDKGSIGLISAFGYDLPLRLKYQSIWAPALLNYAFMVLIYCVVREKLFIRFLEMSWLRYLGKISYGLYVYHFPVLWFVWRIADERFHGDVSNGIMSAVSFSATVLIATLSYYLMERPILNLKNLFFSWSRANGDRKPG